MNRIGLNPARASPWIGEDACVCARTRDFAQRLLMIQTTNEEPMALFHRVADNFTCTLLLPFLYKLKSPPPPDSGSFTRDHPLPRPAMNDGDRWNRAPAHHPRAKVVLIHASIELNWLGIPSAHNHCGPRGSARPFLLIQCGSVQSWSMVSLVAYGTTLTTVERTGKRIELADNVEEGYGSAHGRRDNVLVNTSR
jgi:hypothetical protein